MSSERPAASVRLCVLSGTGNSLRAATWMADVARSVGVHTKLSVVEAGAPAAPSDLNVLAMPCHGFTAPWAGIRFAARMPPGRGAWAAVLATRGCTIAGNVRIPGMEGTTGYLIALILLVRGYRIRGVLGLDMPSNWTSLHWGISKRKAELIMGKSKLAAERFASDLLAGKSRIGGGVSLVLGLALLPISALYLCVGRFLLAKLFFASSRCDGCGLCVANCPNHALGWFGRRPFWTFSCESCMRCMSYCPKRAIQAGHSWAALVWFLANVPVGMLALNHLPWLRPANWLAWSLIQYPYAVASTGLSYLVLSLLLRIRWVNAAFTYTTLTVFYRRYHEPETRLADLSAGDARPRESDRG